MEHQPPTMMSVSPAVPGWWAAYLQEGNDPPFRYAPVACWALVDFGTDRTTGKRRRYVDGIDMTGEGMGDPASATANFSHFVYSPEGEPTVMEPVRALEDDAV